MYEYQAKIAFDLDVHLLYSLDFALFLNIVKCLI